MNLKSHGFGTWRALEKASKAGIAACWLAIGLTLPAEAQTQLQGTNVWTFSYSKNPVIGDSLSTPALGSDGTIYAAAFDGRLNAVSPEGKEQWHFQTGREIKSSPSVGDDGTIYVGSRDHHFYAITPAGKLKWKFATDGWVDSSPAIGVDGVIYFGSWDKNFYALNPDGSLRWKFETGGIVDSSPAIATDGTIYFGSHDKKFYALAPDGKPRWNFATEAEITASPAIDRDGSIYISSTDGILYHLKDDGTVIWRCRTGSGCSSSPVITEEGSIAIAAMYKTLIISSSGSNTWSFGSPDWIDQTPLILQGMVCFSRPWHGFQAVTPEGKGLWYAEFKGNLTSSPMPGAGGQIYFAMEKQLVCIQAPTAVPAGHSPWPMFRADVRHTGRVQKEVTEQH